MSLTIKWLNTWAACLFETHRPDYYTYIRKHADTADIFHLSEVHSCTDLNVPKFVNPEDAGHREGPLHVRQLQMLKEVLGDTHHIYFEPQMNGLHDLDNTHPTVQYGNVTCVRKGLVYDIVGGMVYGTFNKLNDKNTGGTPAGKSGHSVMVIKDDNVYQSVHTHGHWDNRSKIDTRERWMQFKGLLEFAQNHRVSDPVGLFSDAKLIVGDDFNLTSQCEVLEGIRKSKLFGDNGGVILNHEFQDGDEPMPTRTNWYPFEKKGKRTSREANFVIAGPPHMQVEWFARYDAPSDHMLMEGVFQ